MQKRGRDLALRKVPTAMNTNQSTEEGWATWFLIQEKAVQLSYSGDFEAAISQLDTFSREDLASDIKRQVIGFRGDLRREQGDLHGARSDFLAALDLSAKPDFERFTLESALGVISKQLGDKPEAERWFLGALHTAAEDPTISGISALRSLSQTRGTFFLSTEERKLVERVVVQAWRILRLPGEPDLKDIFASAWVLYQAQARPKPPSE
jgi:tetratricopeptide (TPR) repeat protein